LKSLANENNRLCNKKERKIKKTCFRIAATFANFSAYLLLELTENKEEKQLFCGS